MSHTAYVIYKRPGKKKKKQKNKKQKKTQTTKKAQTKKHILVCKDISNHLQGLWQYNLSFKSCIQSVIVSL